MSGLAVWLTCLISGVFFQTVTGQHAVVEVDDPFDSFQSSSHDATGSHSNSNTVNGRANRSAPLLKSGKGTFGNTRIVPGFGSECSLERQCNVLLGLACKRSRCACAPSTPVYVNEGGVQKCVRPKELYEACVSNQECSFKNPNVQCVSFLCNCSHPFQLTPARLCQLPSGSAGSIFPAAISVMLVLATLVAAGGYAYQKMLRERERSSSLSAKAGLGLQADTASTTSTARVLGGGWTWRRRREHSESEYDMLEEPRWLRTQSEISLPRLPPRYISYRASRHRVMALSTLHECCSQAERSSSPSESEPQCVCKEESEKKEADVPLLRRTSEKRDLACQRKREIDISEAKPECSVQSSSTPMHMLLPKDDQMRKLLNDDHDIVVTVETQKGRHRFLTTPSPPPVFSLPRREPPPYESTTTDDPFMKDLKRRRCRLRGRRSVDLSTAVTASTFRSTSPGVTTGRLSEGVALASVHKAQQAGGPSTMSTLFEASTPVHDLPTSTKPAKQRDSNVEPAATSTSKMPMNGKSPNVAQKDNASMQVSATLNTNDERPVAEESGRRSMGSKCETAKSDTSAECVTNTHLSPEILLKSAERCESSKGSATEQSTISMKTVLGATMLHRLTKGEGQNKQCVIADLDILAACPSSADKVDTAKRKVIAKTSVNSTAVTALPPSASMKTDVTEQVKVRPGEVKIDRKRYESRTDLVTAVTSRDVSNPRTICSTVRSSPEGQFLFYDKSDIAYGEQISMAQVGQIASQLLLGMVEVHGEEARASSLAGIMNRDVHSVSSLEAGAPRNFCDAATIAPVSARPTKAQAEPTVREQADITKTVTEHDVNSGMQRSPTKFNYSPNDEPRDYASEDCASGKALTSNANSAFLTGVLKSTKANQRTEKGIANQVKPREVTWPSSVNAIDDTSIDVCPRVKFAPAGPTQPAHDLNETVADDANLSISKTSRKNSQHGTRGVLEDHRASVNSEGVANENELTKFSVVREPDESIFETRNNSPSFAEAGGLRHASGRRASASSVISETNPSLSFQKPYQELMAKIMQHPMHFTERPFADVLASLESEFTSIVKDEQKVDEQDEREKTTSETKLPDTDGHLGSRQSDKDDENLDETVLGSFLADDDDTDFEADVGSDEAVETCTSADSAKLQSRHCLATPADSAMKRTLATRTTAATLESEGAPTPKSLQDHNASAKESMPSSKSHSLAFGFSNTSCHISNHPSNQAEPRRSAQSVMAVTEALTCKTDCVNTNPELHVTASREGRTKILEEPTSLRSGIGFQTQLPVSGASQRPQLSDHQFITATDRLQTTDFEKVATLGNQHYIQQHEAQQHADSTTARLDETQKLLFSIQNPTQPAMPVKSQRPTPSNLNQLIDELRQGSREFVQGALNNSGAASSNRDLERHESTAACFQPPNLKDLAARVVLGLDKRIVTMCLSKAYNKPSLRTLSSQVLPPAETAAEKCATPAKRDVNMPSCSSCARLQTSGTAIASPNETPSKKKGPRARLSLDALAETTVNGTGHKEEALPETQLRRRGRSQSVVITGVSHEWSDQGSSPSGKANAAEQSRTAKGSIRIIGPPVLQRVVVLPDPNAAIRLPEGAGQADPSARANGASLRRGSVGSGLAIRNWHLQLASALEYPSFESIYNAILQADLPEETALEASGPGDVPSRPARSASRAVSFDNSPTVVPLEPPPEPFAEHDPSQMAMEDEQAATPPQFHRQRRRSSLCRSSSGSLLQEVTGAADLFEILDARRASFGLPPLPAEQSSTSDDDVTTPKSEAGPDATRSVGSAATTQEHRSPLTSPFFSFEDTMSELSSLPDTTNLNSSSSVPGSQRNEGAGARDQQRGSPV